MAKRTAGDLAEFLGSPLQGDSAVVLKGVASPEAADTDDLVYLESSRHTERVIRSAARCVITSSELMISGKTLILTPRPKLAFARAAAWLVPHAPIAHGVHATAVHSPSDPLGRGGVEGPLVVLLGAIVTARDEI